MEIAGQDYANNDSFQRRVAALRRLTGEQRLKLAFEMLSTSNEIARAGIRTQHPTFSPEQVELELARRITLANGAASIISARR
jgi:hypothetical protein